MVRSATTCARPDAASWPTSQHGTPRAPDPEVETDPHAHYERVLELDLSQLEPHVTGPHAPDRARPLSQLAAELRDPQSGFVDVVSVALIGSCTNSSYEDMRRAA